MSLDFLSLAFRSLGLRSFFALALGCPYSRLRTGDPLSSLDESESELVRMLRQDLPPDPFFPFEESASDRAIAANLRRRGTRRRVTYT